MKLIPISFGNEFIQFLEQLVFHFYLSKYSLIKITNFRFNKILYKYFSIQKVSYLFVIILIKLYNITLLIRPIVNRMKYYIGVTNNNWYDYLKKIKPDEVNFWRPSNLVRT